MQVDEDWSNVITPTAPSYDTSNQLSAVSEHLLRMSFTELSYSSQVYTSDYCTSETWRCLLRFIFGCVAVLSDENWLPSYVVDVLVNERQRVVGSHSQTLYGV